jgi:hypothetical protein
MMTTVAPANLELVSDTLSTARAAIEAGHLVDVCGLDLAVAELCAATVQLPPRHHGRAARKLARLAKDLSALAQALTTQREGLERMAETEARQRAAGAYAADSAPS